LGWERNHPGRRYEDRPLRQTDRQPHRSEARPIPSVRSCKECGLVKAIAEFTPTKRRTAGWYGRCRVCRARRVRERYWAVPDEREQQKARVRRNRQRRQAAAATSTWTSTLGSIQHTCSENTFVEA